MGRNSQYLIYFIVFDLFPKTDLLQFRDSICHSIFISKQKKEILKTIFFKAAYCRYKFKRMIHYYRWRKSRDAGITTDMYQNKLDTLSIHNKIAIIQNGTKFIFRRSDLLTIWIKKLTNSDDLFSMPLEITNPYTGTVFAKHNLYNIYFALFNSSFHIPPLLVSFFCLHFNIENFKIKNFPILQDIAIQNHYENLTEDEKLSDIVDMVNEHVDRNDSFRAYITPINRKNIIKRLGCLLLSYYYTEYSANPLIKRQNRNILMSKIKIIFTNYPDCFKGTFV